jgi:hypothetical protein
MELSAKTLVVHSAPSFLRTRFQSCIELPSRLAKYPPLRSQQILRACGETARHA